MTATIKRVQTVTEEEYLAFERVALDKHEFINGQIVAMSGGTRRHAALAANLIGALHARLRGTGCRTFTSDLRVHVSPTGLYTYPDVSVACGPLETAKKDTETITSPCVIFEVLSESSEAYDRGAKFAHYRSIASLRSYVLVAQNEQRVERYDRLDDGDWRLHDVVAGDVVLPCLSISIPLAELYENLPD